VKPKSTCVFVGGPIQYATHADGSFHTGARSTIELIVQSLVGSGHRILSAHFHERFGKKDVTGESQHVCSRDFRWMQQCDVFVAVLPLDAHGNVIHSAGTAVELGWASALGKPIVLVCDPAPKYSHLVIGLGAVARVMQVDINRPDLGLAVREAVRCVLESADLAPLHGHSRSSRSARGVRHRNNRLSG